MRGTSVTSSPPLLPLSSLLSSRLGAACGQCFSLTLKAMAVVWPPRGPCTQTLAISRRKPLSTPAQGS